MKPSAFNNAGSSRCQPAPPLPRTQPPRCRWHKLRQTRVQVESAVILFSQSNFENRVVVSSQGQACTSSAPHRSASHGGRARRAFRCCLDIGVLSSSQLKPELETVVFTERFQALNLGGAFNHPTLSLHRPSPMPHLEHFRYQPGPRRLGVRGVGGGGAKLMSETV